LELNSPSDKWWLRRSISPEVNAVSTLIFAASTLLLVGALAIQAGAARRRLLQFRQDGRPGGEAALLDPQHSPQHTWEET